MKTLLAVAAMGLVGFSTAAAQAQVKSSAVQIASAISPLPAEFRDQAKVLGYVAGSKTLSELRAGKGAFTCLADDPSDERFHVACYHNSLEPFMGRGRELRASGVRGQGVDSVRFAEIKSGKLAMPKNPATLYSITLKLDEVDAQTGAVPATARPLYVVYIPFETAESTGLPKTPAGGMPWIMFPGSPKAHIMFTPTM